MVDFDVSNQCCNSFYDSSVMRLNKFDGIHTYQILIHKIAYILIVVHTLHKHLYIIYSSQ